MQREKHEVEFGKDVGLLVGDLTRKALSLDQEGLERRDPLEQEVEYLDVTGQKEARHEVVF